jgi:hypothetical protein
MVDRNIKLILFGDVYKQEQVKGKVGGSLWSKYSIHMYENATLKPVKFVPRTKGQGCEGERWKGWV